MKISLSLFITAATLLSAIYYSSFQSAFLDSFTLLNLGNIKSFEKKYDGKAQDFSGITVNIGQDYYPNLKGYDIGSAHIYVAPVSERIERRGEYFFSSDSVLRVALFNYFALKDAADLKKQFTALESEISEKLGTADKELNSKETQKNWYTTSRRWTSNGKLNVYISLTGSDKNKPQRLRAVVYID